MSNLAGGFERDLLADKVMPHDFHRSSRGTPEPPMLLVFPP
jgi:hypothetical protein